jgi:hypothetical protein
MIRKLIAASALTIPLSLTAAKLFLASPGIVASPAAAPAAQSLPGPGCPNFFVNEPLVVYDITGYTLTGLLHLHLTVYSSGTAQISEAGGGAGPFPFVSMADVAYVTPEAAEKLWKTVVTADAMSICDYALQVSDVPLTTITVHRGDTNSAAHTYSYWVAGTPQMQAVDNAIQNFIHQYFPNF